MRAHRPWIVSPGQGVTPGLASALSVFIVAFPPGSGFIAPPGCAIEPLISAPQAVQTPRIRGIGVIDDAVLARERAQPRPLTHERGQIRSAHRRALGPRALADGFAR